MSHSVGFPQKKVLKKKGDWVLLQRKEICQQDGCTNNKLHNIWFNQKTKEFACKFCRDRKTKEDNTELVNDIFKKMEI